MTWGAVAGAAIGVVGSALSSNGGGSSSNGGAGMQTQSKEPWAAAQPWIMNNLVQGQNLQNAYAAQPFNAQQQQAYGNMANQSAYMRAAVPSLLRQIQGQQVGFDRGNPNLRPNAFSFDGISAADQQGQQAQQGAGARGGGLLDLLTNGGGGAVNSAVNPPAPAPAPAAPASNFTQQGWGDPMLEQQIKQFGGLGGNTPYIDPRNYTGALGTFKYGDPMPQPGTQAYKDMSDYFAYGGADPLNMYGKGAPNPLPDRSATGA